MCFITGDFGRLTAFRGDFGEVGGIRPEPLDEERRGISIPKNNHNAKLVP